MERWENGNMEGICFFIKIAFYYFIIIAWNINIQEK
jgi:hypothetical protein